ncbi:ATP-binding protein [Maribacter chungangensis]|uniref:histidine kinase n=1 Tax=Maribacter chungangensis TaxID=1069117 RepID=A0ABW3B2S3_9FLAO
MSKLKTKDLLGQLSDLEASLNGFSFEELKMEEAKNLKESFNRFKSQLNDQLFGAEETQEKTHAPIKKIASKQIGQDKKLIAHVSHEIRTPLNGIIGFANLLREENLTESQSQKVQAIQSASYNLMEIINEVLEYSKLSTGIANFDAVDFNVHGLIKDVMFLCQTLIVDKSVALKINITPNVPKVLVGDPSKLSQVLLNLLGNAIKFVEKGHIKLSVDLKEQKNETYMLQFTVEDTGIGISQEQLGHIFESYKQAAQDTFRKYGGSGLGLSIVKEIIEKQGGSISVSSKLGEGTTFKFEIPFGKGNIHNIPKTKPKSVSTAKGKKLLGGTKILIFEDNELNQHLISEQLNKWDCITYVTEDPKEGLSILRTEQIDIVLMDLKMPRMSGFEITKNIRALAENKISNVPIIAFSADFTAKDEERCYESGINDFLLKPYTLNELMIKLLKRKKERSLTQESLKLLKTETIIYTDQKKETVDLTALLKECYGELDMLQELIRLFKQNIYEFIGSVKIGISNHAFEEIQMAAHKIKAGLALMNTTDLKQLVVGIEGYAKKSEMMNLEPLFNQFLREYPLIETLIDLELAKLKKS